MKKEESNPNLKSGLKNTDFKNLIFKKKNGYFRPIFHQNLFYKLDFQYLFSVQGIEAKLFRGGSSLSNEFVSIC